MASVLVYTTGKPLRYNRGDSVEVFRYSKKNLYTEDMGSIPASANAGILISYHWALVRVAKSLLPRTKRRASSTKDARTEGIQG